MLDAYFSDQKIACKIHPLMFPTVTHPKPVILMITRSSSSSSIAKLGPKKYRITFSIPSQRSHIAFGGAGEFDRLKTRTMALGYHPPSQRCPCVCVHSLRRVELPLLSCCPGRCLQPLFAEPVDRSWVSRYSSLGVPVDVGVQTTLVGALVLFFFFLCARLVLCSSFRFTISHWSARYPFRPTGCAVCSAETVEAVR